MYGHVMGTDISSQIQEVMKVELTGKRKKVRPKKLWEKCIDKDMEWYGLRRNDACGQKKWQERIRAKIANAGRLG